MQTQITLWECVTSEDQQRFWTYLKEYFARDLWPGEVGRMPGGAEYRQRIQALHDRAENPMHYLLFRRDGQEIGLALTVVYATEDGKQFILEFCVFPEFRGKGTGKACAAGLLDWGRAHGAKFAELNADSEPRRRFWASVGFVPNGRDRWGEPLMLLPPSERIAPRAEVLTDPEELWDLESGFLAEIGEEPLDEAKRQRLERAIAAGQIVFFVARRLNRPIGICSVSPCFSTFDCRSSGVFDDFYVEPAFRHQGVARVLAEAARGWCLSRGMASLTVGCSPGDVGMYRALGFETSLGTLLAQNLI